MKIDTLLGYLEPLGDDNHAVRQGVMLTMLDPSERTNAQVPIELVAFITEDDDEGVEESFVVINLILDDDALWFKRDGFDEDITVWEMCK